MRRLFGMAAVVGVMLWAPSTAQAVTIGPTCGTCGSHATSFDITFTQIDASTGVYDVTIQANYVGPTFDWTYLAALGISVSGAKVEGISVQTVPDGQSTASWSTASGTLNASGCEDNNGDQYACIQYTGSTPPFGVSRPGPDTWVLRIDFDTTSALNLANLTGSFKALFTDANGNKNESLISEAYTTSVTSTTGGTPTTGGSPTTGTAPEPTSLVLLGSGLVLAHQRLRRRRVKA